MSTPPLPFLSWVRPSAVLPLPPVRTTMASAPLPTDLYDLVSFTKSRKSQTEAAKKANMPEIMIIFVFFIRYGAPKARRGTYFTQKDFKKNLQYTGCYAKNTNSIIFGGNHHGSYM